jgi:hypothetical protein
MAVILSLLLFYYPRSLAAEEHSMQRIQQWSQSTAGWTGPVDLDWTFSQNVDWTSGLDRRKLAWTGPSVS